jgi:heme-degrading monooxygenase HmoA
MMPIFVMAQRWHAAAARLSGWRPADRSGPPGAALPPGHRAPARGLWWRVMVIVLIRTRLRDDADVAAYEQLNARMEARVQDIPGFVSAKGYRSDDGDEISIVRFESAEALRRWRDLPEHAVAQHRGRDEFFATYDVEVCEVVRAYDFHR